MNVLFYFSAVGPICFFPFDSLSLIADVSINSDITYTFGEYSLGRGPFGYVDNALVCSAESYVQISQADHLITPYGLTIMGFISVTGAGPVITYQHEAGATPLSIAATDGGFDIRIR